MWNSLTYVQNSFFYNESGGNTYEYGFDIISSASVVCGFHFLMWRTRRIDINTPDFIMSTSAKLWVLQFFGGVFIFSCAELMFITISSSTTITITATKIWVLQYFVVEFISKSAELKILPCILPQKLWIRLQKYEFGQFIM